MEKDIEDNKMVAAIGYLFILCLIPLLGKKDSAYAQFHGKQGLVLTIASVIWWFISMFLAFIPIIGWFVAFLGWIGIMVLVILGILNALNGKYWEMPFLGQYAKQIKL